MVLYRLTGIQISSQGVGAAPRTILSSFWDFEVAPNVLERLPGFGVKQ